jgi:enamine deaminase RidA (YjgF/YER057c/UK114 family)
MSMMHGIGAGRRRGMVFPRRVVLGMLGAMGMVRASSSGNLATSSALARQQEGDAMEPVITHVNPEGMHANPAFSQAVTVAGNVKTIYVGGQNAVDAQGAIVGVGDLAAQTEQVFTNLETVLSAAGATLHDVVKWTVFVVQGQDLAPGFAVAQQRLGTSAPPPAISAAFVSSLAHPDFLVEIEAIAVVAGDG